jgi:hypothetical protein
MATIPTGFQINPLVGSIDDQQLIARYLPMERFIQFLETKSLWFTRVRRWTNNDACEAGLLPAYRRYLRNDLPNEGEFLHAQAMMEFELRANLGCCFSLFNEDENDLMWRSYTPEPECGVIIIVRAGAVMNAMSYLGNSFRKNYLAKVKYLSENQVKWMNVQGCSHSRTKKGSMSWDVSESTFFKRDAFKGEREVRAILSPLDSWADLLHLFLRRERIPHSSIYAPTPTDQPYVRIDMRQNLHVHDATDRSVFITIPQMHRLTRMVEEEVDAYFDANSVHGNSTGFDVPFDLSGVEKVILHPRLTAGNERQRERCVAAIQNAGLSCPVVNSDLYARGWQ